MQLKRWCQHLLTSGWKAKRTFPRKTLAAIETAITSSEQHHLGEIRFAVETALELGPLIRNQSARERAIEIFSKLRVWDTEHNNGILIFVLLADKAVEIIADRGINTKVTQEDWNGICHKMKSAFAENNFHPGILHGIDEITQLLITHFPADKKLSNELSNTPVIIS